VAHHRIQRPSNYVFQLRTSGLNTDAQKLSLGDRLKRYNTCVVNVIVLPWVWGVEWKP
jgi:hypothetical protein